VTYDFGAFTGLHPNCGAQTYSLELNGGGDVSSYIALTSGTEFAVQTDDDNDIGMHLVALKVTDATWGTARTVTFVVNIQACILTSFALPSTTITNQQYLFAYSKKYIDFDAYV